MKNQKIERVVNPFIRIAGTQALLWGALGLVVSTLLSWLSGYHYHGLLHFGPAPNPAWWCYWAEHLMVWLVPATVLYRWKDIFPFQNPYGRCLRNCPVRSITDDRNESDLFITPYASDRTSRFYNGTY